MTLLKVKCQVCGAIVEKPWEFEGWFEDKPEDKIYDGYCSDECRDKKMEEIAREYPEENPDLEIECRLDEYIL